MERNQIMQKQKLEFSDILKEAVSIPIKNISFIIFAIITSFPLFCFLVYYEVLLQTTLDEASEILIQPLGLLYYDWPIQFQITRRMDMEFASKLIRLGFLHLVPLHLLELCSMLAIVDLASKIYTEGRGKMTLKEMIQKSITESRLKGTFITSLYVLFLSTCTPLGLIWLVTNYFVILRNFAFHVLFAVSCGAAFVALLMKFMEWTAWWKMSMVISVLEEKYGIEALALSAFFNRGNERRGLLLMLLFCVWENALRLPCLYGRCFEGGNGIILLVGLFCLGNAFKWIACMVYFYDCKKRIWESVVHKEEEKELGSLDA